MTKKQSENTEILTDITMKIYNKVVALLEEEAALFDGILTDNEICTACHCAVKEIHDRFNEHLEESV